VLIKELQSLGLDMRVLGDNMKEIRLREASEEELDKNRSISMDMLGDQVFDDDSALIEGPDGEYEEIEDNDDLVFENEFDNIGDDES
jgi:DNA-directed RNA polymerase subunit beta